MSEIICRGGPMCPAERYVMPAPDFSRINSSRHPVFGFLFAQE